jgi:hypothetical protein
VVEKQAEELYWALGVVLVHFCRGYLRGVRLKLSCCERAIVTTRLLQFSPPLMQVACWCASVLPPAAIGHDEIRCKTRIGTLLNHF